MSEENKIQIFEDKKIRTAWNESEEEWYFSIVDVISVLTDSNEPRRYWSDLKRKLKAEGANQLYENIVQLKMSSPKDGKNYKTDVANTEQLLRIIQSIPSPKAEPFKMWLAEVGRERIDETIDPELTIERALETYLKKGYGKEWINQRLQAIQVRKELTDEFEKMQDKFGKITTISRVGVLNSKTSSDYGAFYDNSGELLLRFANKKNALSKHAQKAQEMKKSGEWSSAHSLHTFRHEIGHAIQLEHRLNDPLWDDKLEQISKIMDGLNEPIDIDIKKYSVSRYSMTNIDDFISECIAESMTKKSRATAKEVVNIIIGVD